MTVRIGGFGGVGCLLWSWTVGVGGVRGWKMSGGLGVVGGLIIGIFGFCIMRLIIELFVTINSSHR